jgi:hypothetical protein
MKNEAVVSPDTLMPSVEGTLPEGEALRPCGEAEHRWSSVNGGLSKPGSERGRSSHLVESIMRQVRRVFETGLQYPETMSSSCGLASSLRLHSVWHLSCFAIVGRDYHNAHW